MKVHDSKKKRAASSPLCTARLCWFVTLLFPSIEVCEEVIDPFVVPLRGLRVKVWRIGSVRNAQDANMHLVGNVSQTDVRTLCE